jgi:phosphopantothenoylcysteine decarboxylase/phosphopantothenate--cysteine ligase
MKLLFIISGSIAVKKCPIILKRLSDKKVHIDCVITNNAKKMIDKKIIQKCIKGKIFDDSSEKNNKMLHISLTRKSDLVVVCPATSNLIAKFAHGYANDLASTSLIASNKQILIMPAMNVEMWNNKINKNNVAKLQKSGVEFIGPNYGYLSCGEIGLGRLSDNDKILQVILDYLKRSKKLQKKKCLVTAGPTLEPIDAVRYISNHSSGKQGFEIAKQLMLVGGNVTLISGPTNLQPPPKVKFINALTTQEMNKAVRKNLKTDIAVFTAAVSDVSPKKTTTSKIKKEKLKKIILKENPDILKNTSLNSSIRPKFVVGFAAETNNHINNAKKKLITKNCDLIVVNKISKKNNVFGSEYNQVAIIDHSNVNELKRMTKIDVAKKLVNRIINNFEK